MAGGEPAIALNARGEQMFRKLLQKLNLNRKEVKEEYSNRFVRFYHLNQKRLIQERRSLYHEKKDKGICVRCNKPALEGIIFCEFHQQKQAGYNQKAREK
mgnify:CR=1 FL=1